MLNKLRKKATALVCTSSYLCILALSAFDNFYLYTIAFCLSPFFYYMRWFKVDVFNRTHFVCRKVFFYRREKNTTKFRVLLHSIILFYTTIFFDLDRFKLLDQVTVLAILNPFLYIARMEDDKNYWKAMHKLTDTEVGIIKLLRSDSDDAFILKIKQEVFRPQKVLVPIFDIFVLLQAFIYFCLIKNVKSLTIERYE